MLPDWFIYALLGAMAAALASIFAKMGLQNVDSITATALRSIVMTIMVFAVLYFTRGYSGLTNLTQREYLFILLSGLAGGASWILYFIALQRGEAGKVAIVDRSSVLFVIVLATLILQEELTVKKILAAVLVFSALVLLAV